MAKLTFYGRRILKWKDGSKTIYTLSGQWVGHSYGSDTGTPKQRRNAAPSSTSVLKGISDKIFWGMTGKSGEIITDKAIISKCDFAL